MRFFRVQVWDGRVRNTALLSAIDYRFRAVYGLGPLGFMVPGLRLQDKASRHSTANAKVTKPHQNQKHPGSMHPSVGAFIY